jgi:hypothetical protein
MLMVKMPKISKKVKNLGKFRKKLRKNSKNKDTEHGIWKTEAHSGSALAVWNYIDLSPAQPPKPDSEITGCAGFNQVRPNHLASVGG